MKLEPYTIVVLTEIYKDWLKKVNYNPFGEDESFVYFGEISNMPAHCVVAGYESGKIYSGYHTEDFKKSEML